MKLNRYVFSLQTHTKVGDVMTFFESASLFSRANVMSQPDSIPSKRGVYAWFFRSIPPSVPTADCYVRDALTLLYIGISPKNAVSRQNLRKRISYHYKGNAEGSTLRLTLGTLLADHNDFPLRRVGSGRRMTFTHLGEPWLDNWMGENAFVCWTENDEPWLFERQLLQSYSLPLNIQDNRHHPFCSSLSAMRSEAKRLAREMPVANEGNQRRQSTP
jgi:hypothetical protein